MGAIPLMRTQLDLRAERNKLRQFMKESQVGFSAPASQYSTPIEGAKPNRMVSEGPNRSAPITNFPKQKIAGVGDFVPLLLSHGAAVAGAQLSSAAADDPKARKELIKAKNMELAGMGTSLAGFGGMLAAAVPVTKKDSALASQVMERSPIPVHQIPDLNAYYHSGDKKTPEQIGVGYALRHSPMIPAHELGHYEIQHNRFGRLLQNTPTSLMGSFAGPVGVASGSLSGLSDNETVQRLGVAAPAILGAPQLAYEAGASALGLRRLHRMGAGKGQLARAALTGLPAWATYLGNTISGVAAAKATQSGVKASRKKNKPKEPKMAFAVSQYSGPLSHGPFRMASGAPPFTAPSLKSMEKKQDALQMAKSSGMLVEHAVGATVGGASGAALGSKWRQHPTAGAAIGGALGAGTGALVGLDPIHWAVDKLKKKAGAMVQTGLKPMGMLSSAQRIGKPKITNPGGPSIGDLSKPVGFGTKIPGAAKGTL